MLMLILCSSTYNAFTSEEIGQFPNNTNRRNQVIGVEGGRGGELEKLDGRTGKWGVHVFKDVD